MAITASSTMTEVRVSQSEVWWQSPDDAQGYIANILDNANNADLAVLQEIYASDPNFGSASISIEPAYRVDSLADLEPNGFINPFIPGFEVRHANRLLVDGAFLQETEEVARDALTGRPDINFKGGLVPARRAPDDDTLNVDLSDWVAITRSTDDGTFLLRVFLHTGDEATEANLGEKTIVRGLVQLLEDNRHAGSTMDATVITDLNSIFGQVALRTFEFEDTTATDGYRFRLDTRQIELTVGGRLVEFFFVQDFSSPDPQSETIIAGINEILDTTTQEVTTTYAAEKPPFGDKLVPVLGETLELDRMKLEADEDHLVVKMADEHDVQKRVIVGQGYSVNYDTLTDSSVADYKLSPKSYGVGVVTFTGSGTGGVTLRDPVDQIPLPGDRVCVYHNRGTANRVIRDWDEKNVCTLLPRERITLRTIRRSDGTGELTDAVPFIRELRIAGFEVGNFSALGYYVTGTDRIRPFRLPNANDAKVYKVHGEVFSFGTGSPVNGSNIGLAATNVSIAEAILIAKAGHLRAVLNAGIAITGSTGTLPRNHGATLYRRSGQLTVVGPFENYSVAHSPDESESWNISWEVDVIPDDIILPLFLYPSSGTTIPMGNLEIASIELDLILSELVEVEYTP